jgi:hypothetical protein
MASRTAAGMVDQSALEVARDGLRTICSGCLCARRGLALTIKQLVASALEFATSHGKAHSGISGR